METIDSFYLISWKMLSFFKNQVEVTFKVRAEVPHGVTIRVSGSVAQLGYFSPLNSIPLYTSPQEYRENGRIEK